MADTYRQLVLDSGPIGFWRFAEPSGLTFQDETANDHDLTANFAQNMEWKATWRVASGSWGVRTPNAGAIRAANSGLFSFEYNTPFSIHLWFYGNGTNPGAAYATFVNKCPNIAPNNGYDFYNYLSKVSFLLRDGTGQLMARDYTPPATLWTTRWTYLAATYDGSGNRSGMKVYFDGALATPAADAGLASMSTSIVTAKQFSVGGRDLAGGFLFSYGYVSDLALYDRVVSAEEIFDFYNFVPIYEARGIGNQAHVLRSVSRPAKNLIAVASSSASARKHGSKLSPGVG